MPDKTRQILTDADKLKAGFVICNKCDRIVLNLKAHQDRSICYNINKTKKLSATTGTEETDNYAKAIAFVRKIRLKKAGII